jgi:catechol 2,3-dioxygenase-like lactoylglutathione lyase family enzyme
MRWMRGLTLFVAGTVLGIFMMHPSAESRENVTGLKLNHVGIYVKDLNESVNFYTKSMGFREAFSFKDKEGRPTHYLQINRDTFLELAPADANHLAGVSHIGIWADDLKASVIALRQKGVKVDDLSLGVTKAPLTNLIDPNGVRVELLDFVPESLQRKAIDNWR